MKKWLLALALCPAVPAAAATLPVSAGLWVGDAYYYVPVQTMSDASGKPYYAVGTLEGDRLLPYVWEDAQLRIELSGTMNPDPYISTGITVTDFGAPSTFAFAWSTPIDPTGPASVVKSSLGGVFTDTTGDGFTFTPANALAPGAALTSSLGDGVAAIDPTPGLAIGPDFGAAASSPGALYTYVHSAGHLPGPVGTWTTLGAMLAFTLGGNEDVASLNVYTEVSAAPLPPALALFLGGLAALGAGARRSRAGRGPQRAA